MKHARINDAHCADDHALNRVVIEFYTDDDFPEDNHWTLFRPTNSRPPWEEIANVHNTTQREFKP
jgi:hypothetical protein